MSMIMCVYNFVRLCPFMFKILIKNQILTSIKGRRSVKNWRKLTLYNPNVDLVMIMCIYLFKILFIHSQDIEQNPNSDVNQGP